MEHIIQIAIAVDDERITRTVEAQALRTIIDDLEQDVRNKLFSPKSAYFISKNATASDPLSDFSVDLIKGFFKKHEDAIIKKAADALAERLSKSKAVKDMVTGLKVSEP